MPFLVGIVAIAAGLVVGRVRTQAGGEPPRPLDPARDRLVRRVTTGVWLGLCALGLLLLWIGWWAWGSAPAGLTPQASASVAYTAAALELFFWGLLTPRVLRRGRAPLTP